MQLLDTTLRDGSYVVDFQFSSEDTKNISKALSNYGIDYIEIGHGLGLGAYRLKEYQSLCNDSEILSVVSENESLSKFGVFFIPGIGTFEDIDLALEKKIDFIRIGINVDQSEKSHKYIEYAKSKGLIVAANFMKSYAVLPQEFANRAKEAEKAGADFVYIVDSAGGMLPDDVRTFIQSTKEVSSVKLGFHGHNNLTLAVANSLIALESGASIVDSSLQGLGRDGGNASTEVLLSILTKKGILNKSNLHALFDYSEINILPLVRNKGVLSIPLISGIGLFHSGFYPKIKELALKNHIDTREVILELSAINIIEPSTNDIQLAIDSIQSKKISYTQSRYINIRRSFTSSADDNIINNLKITLHEMNSLSKKLDKKSVLNIVLTESSTMFASKHIQISQNYIISNCQLNTYDILPSIITLIDGHVDIIMYDAECKMDHSISANALMLQQIQKSRLYLYSDIELWVKSIENTILLKNRNHCKVFVNIENNSGLILSQSLKKFNIKITNILNSNDTFDFIIGIDKAEINKSFINFTSQNTVIIDGGIGSIDQEYLSYCHDNDIEIIRPDMRAVIETEILQKEKSFELLSFIQGRKKIKNFFVTAGGYYGKNGDIVVDSINHPSCVIGIANGLGGVKYNLNPDELFIMKKFEEEVLQDEKAK